MHVRVNLRKVGDMCAFNKNVHVNMLGMQQHITGEETIKLCVLDIVYSRQCCNDTVDVIIMFLSSQCDNDIAYSYPTLLPNNVQMILSITYYY